MIVDNVDTDQIIPSREMKRVSKLGLGDGLFAGRRYLYDGPTRASLDDDFVLNRPEFRNATILLAGKNFGCGSSREHAVWALKDYGIDVIIAESFGRIFRNNCARNGLLAIELSNQKINDLVLETSTAPESNKVTIDLEKNQIRSPSEKTFSFRIAESDRDMLLSGLDHIEFSLQFQADIERFKATDQEKRPWAYIDSAN